MVCRQENGRCHRLAFEELQMSRPAMSQRSMRIGVVCSSRRSDRSGHKSIATIQSLDASMAAVCRERISGDWLRAATKHVHSWLSPIAPLLPRREA